MLFLSFDAYSIGNDAAMLDFVRSADFANGGDMVFERHMSASKCCILEVVRFADPVHTKMPKVIAGWIPGHQIP